MERVLKGLEGLDRFWRVWWRSVWRVLEDCWGLRPGFALALGCLFEKWPWPWGACWGRCLEGLDGFGGFGRFWRVFGGFGRFWRVLEGFGGFLEGVWRVLEGFGAFGEFWSVWSVCGLANGSFESP